MRFQGISGICSIVNILSHFLCYCFKNLGSYIRLLKSELFPIYSQVIRIVQDIVYTSLLIKIEHQVMPIVWAILGHALVICTPNVFFYLKVDIVELYIQMSGIAKFRIVLTEDDSVEG